jgi:hypothetical protein
MGVGAVSYASLSMPAKMGQAPTGWNYPAGVEFFNILGRERTDSYKFGNLKLQLWDRLGGRFVLGAGHL